MKRSSLETVIIWALTLFVSVLSYSQENPATFKNSIRLYSLSEMETGDIKITGVPVLDEEGVVIGYVTIEDLQTVDWGSLVNVPSTFSPSPHTHAAADITSGVFAIARIPTGTTGSTVALGNHTHEITGIIGLTEALGLKQDLLTAGNNINITGNTISSTDTTYDAGNGLTLTGTTFSLPVTQTGSGSVVSSVTQTANGITVTSTDIPSNIISTTSYTYTASNAFTLSSDYTIISVEVNRIPIYLGQDYIRSGNTVTLDNFPLYSGDQIIITYQE